MSEWGVLGGYEMKKDVSWKGLMGLSGWSGEDGASSETGSASAMMCMWGVVGACGACNSSIASFTFPAGCVWCHVPSVWRPNETVSSMKWMECT